MVIESVLCSSTLGIALFGTGNTVFKGKKPINASPFSDSKADIWE